MRRLIVSIFRPLIGWIFGITILWSSLFGAYIISLFLFLILLGKHRTWRRIMDRSVSFWMMVPVGFLELIFGMRVRVSGDEIDPDEPALIIMNHRTRLDWMYLWSALYQINPWLICSNKISLKAQLQSLPGAGFGMSAAQFLFLERNMEKDSVTFSEAIDYYKDMRNVYQVLLFPEGTDKSPWTTTKSLEYAKKNGLKELKHLLYPRVAGFFHLLSKMRDADFISYVYDISIAYPYNVVQSEVDLVLTGACPKEVHFHVTKIPVNEVPRTDVDCGRWLHELWLRKEAALERFYSEPKPYHRTFPLEKGQRIWKNDSTSIAYSPFSISRSPIFSSTQESAKLRFVKRFCFWFWIYVVSVVAYHITFLRQLQIAALYFVVVVFSMKFAYGSLDRFVLYQWKRSSLKS